MGEWPNSTLEESNEIGEESFSWERLKVRSQFQEGKHMMRSVQSIYLCMFFRRKR